MATARYRNLMTASSMSKRYDAAMAVGCLLALGAALVLAWRHHVGTFGVETDFYWAYGPQAQRLLAGQTYTYPFHPPGYSLLLAAVSRLTAGDLFLAGKLLSAAAFGAFGWVTYGMARALFGRRIACLTVLLTLLAALPYSFLASTDVVGAVLLWLPVWFLLRQPAVHRLPVFLAGLTAGAAFLVRTNGLASIFGVGLALAIAIPGTRRARAACLAVFVGGVILVTAPWLLANWRMHGSPFASASYVPVAAHFYLPGGEINSITSLSEAAARFHSPWDVLSRDPQGVALTYLRDIGYRIPRAVATQWLQVPVALAAAAGLAWMLTERSWRLAVFCLAGLCQYLLLGLVNFQTRFYLVLLPVGFLGVVYALGRLEAIRGPRRGLAAGAAGLLAVLLGTMVGLRGVQTTQRTLAAEPRYLLAIASQLRQRSLSSDRIIARKPHLAYLSGMEWVAFPRATTAEEFVAYARSSKARYLVYSDAEAVRWPGLRTLADPARVAADLSVVLQDSATHTIVYELRRSS